MASEREGGVPHDEESGTARPPPYNPAAVPQGLHIAPPNAVFASTPPPGVPLASSSPVVPAVAPVPSTAAPVMGVPVREVPVPLPYGENTAVVRCLQCGYPIHFARDRKTVRCPNCANKMVSDDKFNNPCTLM